MQNLQKVLASVVILILDYFWIGNYMGIRYQPMILKIQGKKMVPNKLYAILTYILLLIGCWVFLFPNIVQTTYPLAHSFLFGAVMFGIYDLTAATVFIDWDMKLAIEDILWGGALLSSSVFISGWLVQFLKSNERTM
jgi:uncharacterized membrane protein